MNVELSKAQIEAMKQLKTGSILCGGVGSGKSRTALAYYYIFECEGQLRINGSGKSSVVKKPKDLYIITTAKKRDSGEWLKEAAMFGLSDNPRDSMLGIKMVVDSWNNIKKYVGVTGAFIIFDEQRVVGYGAWTKAFLKITKNNHWVLLSATPGDQWSDYIPVFIANGFYRNKTDFTSQHCIFSVHTSYPKIERYYNERILERYRDYILVNIDEDKTTTRHDVSLMVDYDKALYKAVFKDRWDPYENIPIQEVSKLFYLLRKVVNSDASRVAKVGELLAEIPRCIIFYNFTYELVLLRDLCKKLKVPCAEWNGLKHDDLPEGERWVYLVQYSAGCEGWNCVTTDSIIFYSQSYSYRMTEQAMGRIDRRNTPYKDLYYYRLRSSAPIDLAIYKALKRKRNFNERSFLGKGNYIYGQHEQRKPIDKSPKS